MSGQPFIICHTCLKPVRPPHVAVHDAGGLPHHGRCLELRRAAMVGHLRSSSSSFRADLPQAGGARRGNTVAGGCR